ncbi:uncharacterized protein LOC142355433 isoform X1 [Convolutriloba macropyga]|uniref:uncharacterized protein LOC142355433 isoform X1 n=2 Tax=Convolutriloba macropyga TaxID=536237 RepID=UPI003F51D448
MQFASQNVSSDEKNRSAFSKMKLLHVIQNLFQAQQNTSQGQRSSKVTLSDVSGRKEADKVKRSDVVTSQSMSELRENSTKLEVLLDQMEFVSKRAIATRESIDTNTQSDIIPSRDLIYTTSGLFGAHSVTNDPSDYDSINSTHHLQLLQQGIVPPLITPHHFLHPNSGLNSSCCNCTCHCNQSMSGTIARQTDLQSCAESNKNHRKTDTEKEENDKTTTITTKHPSFNGEKLALNLRKNEKNEDSTDERQRLNGGNSTPNQTSLTTILQSQAANFAMSDHTPGENSADDFGFDLNLPRIPKPGAKLRTVNWQKLPRQSIMRSENNLWRQVLNKMSSSDVDSDENGAIDFATIEEYFKQRLDGESVGENRGEDERDGDGESIRSRKDSNTAGGKIRLLDERRALAINVLIKQFRCSHGEILGKIRRADSGGIGVERLKQLQKILPNSKELELLRGYTGEKAKLDEAERFLKLLISLPHYDLRLESMLIKESFDEKFPSIQVAIDSFKTASKGLFTFTSIIVNYHSGCATMSYAKCFLNNNWMLGYGLSQAE